MRLVNENNFNLYTSFFSPSAAARSRRVEKTPFGAGHLPVFEVLIGSLIDHVSLDKSQ